MNSQTDKTLILTVGLPRSGKSTWSQVQKIPVVNPDSIRLALHGCAYIQSAEPMVWTIAELMVKSLFLAGHNTVILDATNTTKANRDKWKSDKWSLKYFYFGTSKAVCQKRAIDGGKQYLVEVIERMSNEFEPLTDEELGLTPNGKY